MSSFNGSYKGIGELLRADFIEADMLRRAERVKSVAEASAPVARTGNHRGRYKASFRASAGIRPGKAGRRTRRACGRVVNTAPEARFVEYGAKGTPRYRTLGNALMVAAGE